MKPTGLPMCLSAVTILVRGAVALTALTAVVGTAPPAAFAQVDHFTCYKAATTSQTARFTAVPGVSLVDALGSSSVDVKRSKMLCAPTNKNGEDPTAPSHPDHLEGYQTKRPAFTAVVNQKVTDQFGTIFVDLRKPVSLQVPTAKSHTASPAAPTNPAVDHFQCYKVRTSANSARFVTVPGVTIQDQFGTMTVDVKQPRRLCLPANKRNEEPGAENHPDHLMCYGIKQTSPPLFTTQSPLFVNNQFGPLTLDARKPLELCVPALRNPVATPTATALPDTPTPNAGTPTRTATPTSTGSADTPVPTRTPTRTPTPTGTASGACVLPNPVPAVLAFQTRPGIDLDTGWTGVSHDLPGVDDGAYAAVRTSNCDLNTSSPTCGQCDIDGPVRFPGPSKNCACYNLSNRDASTLATCDPEMPSTCTTPETCQCFYGPPLPLSSGAVPVCVINRYKDSLTGTANIANIGPHAGEGAALVHLEASVHNGATVARPCPVCENDPTPRDGIKGGTCNGGARNGQACDVAGTNDFFGAMSFDCHPVSAASAGKLDIRFNQATTGTSTLATAGVKCTATGHTNATCFCDTCASAAAEACNSNADCSGGATCGGKRCLGGANAGTPCTAPSQCASNLCGRPGQATAPNQCDDDVCSPDASDPNPHDGVCEVGPFDNFCSIETFRGCTTDSECNPPSCADCMPGQVCGGDFRNCFLDPIVRAGTAGTQNSVVAATFCIPPVAAASINAVVGLPGPGALLQPSRIFRSVATCGDGMLDAGEQCDGQAGACPGTCLPSCQCPTCGDGQMNQPAEQCDGDDDSNCPGQCGPSCTCGAQCGNNVVEFGEQCDGTATNGQCPSSACQANCTCGPYCGDNTVDPGEQCDGSAGNGQCPASACQANCTCGPYCGDGTINPGEQCDGAVTGACAGTCQSDCTCSPFCGNNIKEAGELCDGTSAALCPSQCQPDCTCPAIGELSFVVIPGADLDTGWTGTSHDFGVQAGSTIAGEIAACDGQTDTECTFFGNVGSACSGDASRSCTDTTQCAVGQTCVINTYGPPLPLSSGGVPVCVINRFSGDVTGTYDTATGDSEITVPLNSLVHVGTDVSRPCPICNCGQADPQNCAIGQTGTCSDNPLRSCTVQGTGPFGPTSNDCPPNSASNISGSGLNLGFAPATTGTTSFASNQPCTGSGFQSQGCGCSGQSQPSACLNACDGGSNTDQPCSADSDCPGAPAGACKPLCRQIVGEAVGEGECAAGPVDQTCAAAPQVGCSDTSPCPAGLGPCVSVTRRCFLDPIVRVGVPSITSNVFGATFCIAATTSPAVNSTAGLPGPGAIRFPNAVTAKLCGDGIRNRPSEACDGADASNCPGNCLPDCTCNTVCGNNVKEFGEQCDGTDSAACTGTCKPPGDPAECTCPAVCGDGFVGPGEQCDPGGVPPGTPASDAACPGACNAVTCQCPTPICGNGMVEAGEFCELPSVNCGPLQICVACMQCAP